LEEGLPFEWDDPTACIAAYREKTAKLRAQREKLAHMSAESWRRWRQRIIGPFEEISQRILPETPEYERFSEIDVFLFRDGTVVSPRDGRYNSDKGFWGRGEKDGIVRFYPYGITAKWNWNRDARDELLFSGGNTWVHDYNDYGKKPIHFDPKRWELSGRWELLPEGYQDAGDVDGRRADDAEQIPSLRVSPAKAAKIPVDWADDWGLDTKGGAHGGSLCSADEDGAAETTPGENAAPLAYGIRNTDTGEIVLPAEYWYLSGRKWNEHYAGLIAQKGGHWYFVEIEQI
jgi:hypothetical protein